MPRARFDQYAVEYKTQVTRPHGLNVTEVPRQLFMGEGLNVSCRAYVIRPAGRIEFVVNGSIQNFSARVMPIRIGFVQSVVAMESRAFYQGEYLFERYFELLPMKDGSGQPWYKPEDVVCRSPQPNLEITGFRIATWDLPQFGFPKLHQEKSPLRAFVREEFITCVMAQINGKNYFLHEFRWTFKGEWGGITAPLAYQLTRDSQLPAPYKQPREIKLNGPIANNSAQEIWG